MLINYEDFIEGLKHRVGKLEVEDRVKRDPRGFPTVVQFNVKIHTKRPDSELVTYSFVFRTDELSVVDTGAGPSVSVSFKGFPSTIFTEADGPKITQHVADMYGQAMLMAVKKVLRKAVNKGLTPPDAARVH